jgi:hypothetical protein
MAGEVTDTTVNNLPRTIKRQGPGNNTIRGGDGKILYEDKGDQGRRSVITYGGDGKKILSKRED